MKLANTSPMVDTEALAESLTFAYQLRMGEILTIEEMLTYKAMQSCVVAWTAKQRRVAAKIERDPIAIFLLDRLNELEGRAPERFIYRNQQET